MKSGSHVEKQHSTLGGGSDNPAEKYLVNLFEAFRENIPSYSGKLETELRRYNSPILNVAKYLFLDEYSRDIGSLSRLLKKLGLTSRENLLFLRGDGNKDEKRLVAFLNTILGEENVFEPDRYRSDKEFRSDSRYTDTYADWVLYRFNNFIENRLPMFSDRDFDLLFRGKESDWTDIVLEISKERECINKELELWLSKLESSVSNFNNVQLLENTERVRVITGFQTEIDTKLKNLAIELFNEEFGNLVEGRSKTTRYGLVPDSTEKLHVKNNVKDEYSILVEKQLGNKYKDYVIKKLRNDELQIVVLGNYLKTTFSNLAGTEVSWNGYISYLSDQSKSLKTISDRLSEMNKLNSKFEDNFITLASYEDMLLLAEGSGYDLEENARLDLKEIKSNYFELFGQGILDIYRKIVQKLPLVVHLETEDGDCVMITSRPLEALSESSYKILAQNQLATERILGIYFDSIRELTVADDKIIEYLEKWFNEEDSEQAYYAGYLITDRGMEVQKNNVD